MFASSYSGLFFVWLDVFVITCWDMLQGLFWAGLCRMIYCTACGPLLALMICVGVQRATFLSVNLDDAAFNWAFSCFSLTDSVVGERWSLPLEEMAGWNADSQNLPLENALLTENTCAEMHLFHQIFGGIMETFPIWYGLFWLSTYKNKIVSLYGMKCDYLI